MKFNVKEMYRVTPAPPKWELQEYIRKYIESNDEKYFFWFLHYYEPQMNRKVYDYASRCDVDENFTDIKQSMAIGMYNALNTYDINLSPFLSYAEHYMEREIEEFLRLMIPPYSVQSEYEYARLRKVMVLFRENGEKSDHETIQRIADQVGTTEKQVVAILTGGLRNESKADNCDENGEEREDLYVDANADPAVILEKAELYELLYFTYFSLEYTERLMLSQRLGFCPNCLSLCYYDKHDRDNLDRPVLKAIKPMPYTDIATSHGFSDPDTAKRICEKALETMRKEITRKTKADKKKDDNEKENKTESKDEESAQN